MESALLQKLDAISEQLRTLIEYEERAEKRTLDRDRAMALLTKKTIEHMQASNVYTDTKDV